jgi:hypothetical protein
MTVGFKVAALVTTTPWLPENKHMGSDTVTISIATDEEIKPVDGADSEQVYLNTVSTSIPAAVESRKVGLTTVGSWVDNCGKCYGEAGTTGGVVTTVNSTATGEEDTQVHTSENSSESVDCKRGEQFPSPASATPVEKAHTGPLTERGYSVAIGFSQLGDSTVY